MNDRLKIRSYVVTDKGMIRENNEDNFYINGRYMTENENGNSLTLSIDCDKHSQTFAVCDGMGGEAFGEIASLIVAKQLSKLDNILDKKVSASLEYKAKAINNYVSTLNSVLCQFMQNEIRTRMGSTLSGLHIFGNSAITFNIGDSRVYIFRDNKLKQLTNDHTEAQRLVRLGVIDEVQARTHKSKHQLTRHFGILDSEGILEADISAEFQIEKNDVFILCSDGLADMLSEADIIEVLTQTPKVDEIHTNLLQKALDMGGHDNITIIVVKIS